MAQLGSSPNHWWRFCGVGRTSYTALIMKLSLFPSISHSSFHVILRLSTPSQLVHCPCFACATALTLLAASSCRRTSSTTSFLLEGGEALCHVSRFSPNPIPALPYCTNPTISPCFNAAFASFPASSGFHFLPVLNCG